MEDVYLDQKRLGVKAIDTEYTGVTHQGLHESSTNPITVSLNAYNNPITTHGNNAKGPLWPRTCAR